MILTSLGWLAALGLLALAVSSGWHGWRDKTRGQWVAFGLYACGAVIMLAVDGALPALEAAVLAFLALAVAGAVALAEGRADADGISWRSVLGSARGGAGAGIDYFGRGARSLWQRLRDRRGAAAAAPQAGSPQAAIAEAAASRAIPSVMEDPFLGPAPEPAELATAAVPVPAPYAALAQHIAGFEPADDMELRMFMDGHVAGGLAIADAWHHFADVALNGAGLDPAYVAGLLEAGDSAAEHASLLSQVHKRFGVIYAAIKEWIGAHGPLPKNARDFLTGDM